MSKVYILILMLPIAYLIAIALDYIVDFLLTHKKADFAEWQLVYTPPFCPRKVLVPLVYLCLVAGYLVPHTLRGQILSCLLLVQLLVVVLVDYRYKFIFDEQNLLLAVLGLWRIQHVDYGLTGAALACVGSFVVMFLLAFVSRGSLGGGDVKLMTAASLWLGPLDILHALFYGVMLGGIGALVMLVCRLKRSKEFVAYGPYLCLGIVYAWYLSAGKW